MKKIVLYTAALMIFAGCREKYESPVVTPVTGYLVVEGIVNSGPGTTTITLSRSTQLNNRTKLFEKGALVKLESDNNQSIVLKEVQEGQYAGSNLNLDPARRYRLSVTTAGNKQYQSDYVAVRNNPPIDSISWKREDGGLQLYVSTHDPKDSTRYYQWEYTETWEFHSAFPTYIKYQVDKIGNNFIYSLVFRDSVNFSYIPEMLVCYNSQPSTSILLGSSAKLSKDAIYLPLHFIEPASYKLSVLYSIEVKQYSWTRSGYAIVEQMKKNTESTGSVFDAQPSEINGNIHCITDPKEPVIGYVNICPVQTKRIFIKSSEVPGWNYFQPCQQWEFDTNSDSIKTYAADLTPTGPGKLGPRGGYITFFAAPESCVDCRLRGTPVKPSFWP
jgi:Domain of unknown function (DUF4249)